MAIIQAASEAAMADVAAALVTEAVERSTDGAVVVGLSGDLGAGKTTLVQAIARHLGVTETVTSPTYVVMKRYALPGPETATAAQPFTELVHIDAYRIEDVDEMRVIGFAALLAEKGTMICIEWPEHIASLLPPDTISVELAVAGAGREITIA